MFVLFVRITRVIFFFRFHFADSRINRPKPIDNFNAQVTEHASKLAHLVRKIEGTLLATRKNFLHVICRYGS